MEQLNRIELRGYVGAVNTTEVGDCGIMRFSMVTSLAYRANDGTAVIESTWFNCLYFLRKDLDKELPDLKKGDMVYLTGRLKSQCYTDYNGVRHDTYSVLVKNLEKIEGEVALTLEK